MRNIEETKTERTLRQFLQRFKLKKKKYTPGRPGATPVQDLNAYPYSSTATMKVLLSSEPHYSYRHSLLKTLRLMARDLTSLRFMKRAKRK